MKSKELIRKKLIISSPVAYAKAAILAEVVARDLVARLDWVKLQPKTIVDMGCGTGYCANLLRERYPAAKIIGIDICHSMLQYAKQQVKNTASGWMCADAAELPLKQGTVDLIVANLLLPWCSDGERILREWQHLLRPGGLLMFTSLGPDTLRDWQFIMADKIVPDLIDMHHVGDALLHAKFADPVMDVDYLTLTYPDVNELCAELQAFGMVEEWDVHREECPKQLLTTEGKWPVVYEVVYGHAWKPEMQVADEDGTVKIPLSSLRRRREIL